MKFLAVIPARGGSRGIPRKNVRMINGNPLISYSIKNALKSKYKLDVVVTTDDIEISKISEMYGANVLNRADELSGDEITLDPVINDAVIRMEKKLNIQYDVVITIQPTSPLLTTNTLDEAIQFFLENKLDTVISGVNKPHLAWSKMNGEFKPLYENRINRQYLPKHFIETGGFVISSRNCVTSKTRIGTNISIFEIPKEESVDIDTIQDWWIAEKELSKKKIIIRVEGYSEIGLGHIYRGLLLASSLINHNILFVLSKKSDLGIKKIQESFFEYKIIEDDSELMDLIDIYSPNIVINDILNTSKCYMNLLKSKGVKTINFEDVGEGSRVADILINDLYEKKDNEPNHYWGSNYYLLRDEFILTQPAPYKENIENILVLFGGTDPSNLTQLLLQVFTEMKIEETVSITFILGLGYAKYEEFIEAVNKTSLNITVVKDVKNIADYMKNADLAISSQGRTMYELASMTVPTIIMAQNERELLHTFGELKNGFINLGLGKELDVHTIKETILWLMNSPRIRQQMKEYMKEKDLKKGLKRVLNLIEGE